MFPFGEDKNTIMTMGRCRQSRQCSNSDIYIYIFNFPGRWENMVGEYPIDFLRVRHIQSDAGVHSGLFRVFIDGLSLYESLQRVSLRI